MAAELEMLSGSVMGLEVGVSLGLHFLKGGNLGREKDCRVCLLAALRLLLMF